MNIIRHGLSVGIERTNEEYFLTLKAVGKLTHNDYKVIVPMIESAIKEVENPSIKALVDGTELEGWDLRAAWDDFRLGLKHGNEFKKVAVVGNKKWQEIGSKIGSWFIAGEVKYFEDINAALGWLHE